MPGGASRERERTQREARERAFFPMEAQKPGEYSGREFKQSEEANYSEEGQKVQPHQACPPQH